MVGAGLGESEGAGGERGVGGRAIVGRRVIRGRMAVVLPWRKRSLAMVLREAFKELKCVYR